MTAPAAPAQPAPSDVPERMEAVGALTAAAVLAAYAAYQAGDITLDALTELAALDIVAGMEHGQVIALQDYVVAHYDALGVAPAGPLGAELGGAIAERDRLAGATLNIVSEPIEEAAGEPPMRLERLARAEVYNATQEQYADTIAAEPAARGWRRGLNAEACQLCQWWSRDGRVWPAEHRLPTHTGCRCTQIPVFAAEGAA